MINWVYALLLMVSSSLMSCALTSVSRPVSIEDSQVQGPTQESPVSVPIQSQLPNKAIAVILGPGGWRLFAHAGVLAELHKAGYKIEFIAGIEKSVLPAMLYADSPSVSQVEWQLFKLSLNDFIKTPKVAFKHRKTESFPVTFACPSYSLTQSKAYQLQKGLPQATLNMCYEQFTDNPKGIGFANPMALVPLVELASGRAQRVLYIDILSQSEIESNVDGYHYAIWSEAIGAMLKLLPQVEVLTIPLKGESRDFKLRQSWMRQGAKAVQEWHGNQKSDF